jgi:hypothetical protein
MAAAGSCCFCRGATAVGCWRLLLLLRPAAVGGCLLLPMLRLSARGGLQGLRLLRPVALSSLLLIRSPALHPWRRLLSQSLFLILLLLLLMLLPLIAVCWSLTGRREALAHGRHRWCRFAATINTRTGRAIARAWLADPDLSLPILVGGRIHFTLVVFVDLNEFEDLWFGHRQRHMSAGLGHVEFARKQHHEPTGMANAIGDPCGVVAGPPVEIGARRSDDR